jgi:hypothetical protein
MPLLTIFGIGGTGALILVVLFLIVRSRKLKG